MHPILSEGQQLDHIRIAVTVIVHTRPGRGLSAKERDGREVLAVEKHQPFSRGWLRRAKMEFEIENPSNSDKVLCRVISTCPPSDPKVLDCRGLPDREH